MPRQVQFLTSASVRGAAVYASGEIATFEDFIAADLIARGRAVAWPPPESSGGADGLSEEEPAADPTAETAVPDASLASEEEPAATADSSVGELTDTPRRGGRKARGDRA